MNELGTRRRRLLRGSLAAPLVLTVAPPAALAASSFTACLDRGATLPQPDKPFSISKDGWYRVEIKVFQLKVRGVVQPDWYFRSLDRSRYFNVDVYDTVGISAFGCEEIKSSTRHCLVYFDDSGNKVGQGWLKNGGKCATTSCWASFKGVAA